MNAIAPTRRRALAACLWLSLACGDAEPAKEAPFFPADYAASYVEVRDCRPSGDHLLSPVRVLAEPAAATAYLERDRGFDAGVLLMKAEYDFADPECQGDIVRWTLMRRLLEGSSPATLDWDWQEVDAARRVVSTNDSRCIGCHTACGVAPVGYLGTCTEE